MCALFTLQFVQLISTVETVQTSVVYIVATLLLWAERDVSVMESVSLDVRPDGLVTTVRQVHVVIVLLSCIWSLKQDKKQKKIMLKTEHQFNTSV